MTRTPCSAAGLGRRGGAAGGEAMRWFSCKRSMRMGLAGIMRKGWRRRKTLMHEAAIANGHGWVARQYHRQTMKLDPVSLRLRSRDGRKHHRCRGRARTPGGIRRQPPPGRPGRRPARGPVHPQQPRRTPTAAAFALLHLARGVLNDLDGIASQMREYGTGVRGHVRRGGQHLGHHAVSAGPAAKLHGAAPSGRCAAAGTDRARPLPIRWPRTRPTSAS